MAQVGSSVGINLDELIVVLVIFTLVVGLLPSIVDFSNGSRDGIVNNAFRVPGDLITASNKLWFDDFKFFTGTDATTCKGVIDGAVFSVANNAPVGNNTLTSTELNKTVTENHDLFFFFKNPGLAINILPKIWLQPPPDGGKSLKDVPIVGDLLFFLFDGMINVFSQLTQLLLKMFFLCFSCGLGGLRLLIGIIVVAWVTFKALAYIGAFGAAYKFIFG